jgi:hypothetical protein
MVGYLAAHVKELVALNERFMQVVTDKSSVKNYWPEELVMHYMFHGFSRFSHKNVDQSFMNVTYYFNGGI